MKLEKWITCLESALLAFLIGYGGCACLVSGFTLRADLGTLALWCGSLAIIASVCFRWKLAPVPLGALALLAGYLWHKGVLSLSTEALLYRLTSLYNTGYGTGILRWSDLPVQDADVTAALCAIASLSILLTVRTVCRSRRAILPVVWGLIPLCACLVVTDTVPDVKHLCILFFGLAVLMLSQTTRRRDKTQGNQLAALVAIPTALAVALLFWANPQQSYNKQHQAEELLQLAQDTFSRYFAQGGTVITKRENLADMGVLSNPHLPVMEVTSEKSGTLYLREQVFDTYTGTHWELTNRYSNLTDHDYSQMIFGGQVKISTRYIQSNLFVPYYTEDTQPGEKGYTENTQRKRSYSFDYWYIPDSDEFYRFPFGYAMLRTAVSLPEDTLAWAEETLQPILNYNYNVDTAYTYAHTIAAFVRDSATYNKRTGPMPAGETDFVRWFIEESDTGYCAHFASATAVLLQSTGVPTRYVTGYMVSTQAGKTTTVYMDEAHAWVEYYDPLLGWIVLESTPGDGLPTAIERPTEPENSTTPPVTQPTVQTDSAPEVTRPQQTDPTNPAVTPKPQTDLRWLEPVLTALACVLGAVLLILGQWQLRRKLIVKKLTQGPVNRRAVAYWRQTVLLCRLLRQRPDGELFTLAQKAKFSQHTLTGEELAILEAGLHSVQQQLKAKPLPYRLFCMLVFAVY